MAYSRISARRGALVNLPVTFLQGGQVADPFAIYRVEIYHTKVCPENIVAIFEVPSPADSDYPSPIIRGGQAGNPVGMYTLPWLIPNDLAVPDVYYDVWYYFTSDPRIPAEDGTEAGSVGTDPGDPLSNYTDQLVNSCNRFWVYPDNWFVDGGLQTPQFGFEPLTQKFQKPELRPLEIGIMPIPLYDYDFNFITPLIPYMTGQINIWTENNEQVVVNDSMSVKLRMGSYRSNPFVMSYLLDTSKFFIGTYKYRVTLALPDGTTRVSSDYFISIS